MFTVQMMQDIIGFFKGSNPELIARYKEVMPYSKHGETVAWIMYKATATGVVASVVKGVGMICVGLIKKPIVVHFVPALKYSIWKQYVEAGMSDQVAANKVYMLRAYARMIAWLTLIVAVIVGVSLTAWFLVR